MRDTTYVPNWRFRARMLTRPDVDERSVEVGHAFWRGARAARDVALGYGRMGVLVRVGVASALRAGVAPERAYDAGF